MRSFWAALGFLTSLPVSRRGWTPEDLGRAAPFFPLVGLLIGLLVAGTAGCASRFLPPLPTAALALALWVGATGALHLDGLVDCCDALFAPRTPEERLEILKDTHVGAFGVIGGSLFLIGKFALTASVHHPWPALALAPVLGRWAMVLAIFRYPYARPSGYGASLKAHTGLRQAGGATLITLALVGLAGLLGGGWKPLLALAAVGIGVPLAARWVLRRLPGLTGDVYGALCEAAEALVLLVFVAGHL